MPIASSNGKLYEDDFAHTLEEYVKNTIAQDPKFNTTLTPDEEPKFQEWKQQYAPKDSGYDYDFRGAFKAGITPDLETNHWVDTYKKPNHPTFSDQSQYAKDRPDLAGHWDRENYLPPMSGHGFLPISTAVGETPASTETAGALKQTDPTLPTWDPTKLTSELPKSNEGISVPNAAFGTLSPFEVQDNPLSLGIVGTIKHLLELPERAFKASEEMRHNPGDYNPAPIVETVANFGLGGLVTAPIREAGAGIFGGRLGAMNAQGTPKLAIDAADFLKHSGMAENEIYKSTGVFYGPDGLPRFEISDKGANLVTERLQEFKAKNEPIKGNGWETVESGVDIDIPRYSIPKEGVKMEDIFDHPDFYKAFPYAANIKVMPLGTKDIFEGIKGSHSANSTSEVIKLAPDTAYNIRSVLLHELQHHVQNEEGFVLGSNPNRFKPINDPVFKDLTEIVPKALEHIDKKWETDISPVLEEFSQRSEVKKALGKDVAILQDKDYLNHLIAKKAIGRPLGTNELTLVNFMETKFPDYHNLVSKVAQGQKRLQDISEQAYEQYRRVYGEYEARSVQERANLSTKERLDRHPWLGAEYQNTYPEKFGVRKLSSNELADLKDFIEGTVIKGTSEPKEIAKATASLLAADALASSPTQSKE